MIDLMRVINEDCGLGDLPEPHRRDLARRIVEQLELNVGLRLARSMSEEQLDEFEDLIDAGDDEAACRWLATNCPNHRNIVFEELERCREALVRARPRLLAAAGLS